MAIKLIASDLDGTIIDEFNKIAPDNMNAIQTIHNKNIGFVISTGKTYGLTKNICQDFNAAYGIFANGMQIIDLKTQKPIYTNVLDKTTVLACMKLAKANYLHIHLYTDSSLVTEQLLYMDLRNTILNKDKPDGIKTEIVKDLAEYVKNTQENIYKFIISAESDLTSIKEQLLQEENINIINVKKYNSFKDNIINKEYEYLDISPQNISKGKALNILKDYLKIQDNEVMSIGDNMNDIDMLQASGIKVAVSNAFDDVKNVASYVTTKSANAGGFAEAINKFIV